MVRRGKVRSGPRTGACSGVPSSEPWSERGSGEACAQVSESGEATGAGSTPRSVRVRLSVRGSALTMATPRATGSAWAPGSGRAPGVPFRLTPGPCPNESRSSPEARLCETAGLLAWPAPRRARAARLPGLDGGGYEHGPTQRPRHHARSPGAPRSGRVPGVRAVWRGPGLDRRRGGGASGALAQGDRAASSARWRPSTRRSMWAQGGVVPWALAGARRPAPPPRTHGAGHRGPGVLGPDPLPRLRDEPGGRPGASSSAPTASISRGWTTRSSHSSRPPSAPAVAIEARAAVPTPCSRCPRRRIYFDGAVMQPRSLVPTPFQTAGWT